MSYPHSPPPSRDGELNTTNNRLSTSSIKSSFTQTLIFHDARELPMSPTASLDLSSPTSTFSSTDPEINNLTQITSPPYWLDGSSHQRNISLHSPFSTGPSNGGITLLDNTASEEGLRKNSGCWARGVRIDEFVVCQGNAVVVAGGRASSGRLMGLGNEVGGGLGRFFNFGRDRNRGVHGGRADDNEGGLGLGNGFGAFVVWNVEVETLEGGSFIIRKRYSEFEKLREQLLVTFPNSTAAMPPLPPKSVISKFRPRFLEQRRLGLVYFLNCILLNPEFSGSPVLKEFLFS